MKKSLIFFFLFLGFSCVGFGLYRANSKCFFDFPPGSKSSFAFEELFGKNVACIVRRLDFYQLNFWIKSWSKEISENPDFYLRDHLGSLKKFDYALKREYTKLQDQELSKALLAGGTGFMQEVGKNLFQIKSDSELFPFVFNPSFFVPLKVTDKVTIFAGRTIVGARGLFYFSTPQIKDGKITFSLLNAENSPVALRFAVFNRSNNGGKGKMLTPWSDWIVAGNSGVVSFDSLDDHYLNRGVFVQIEHNGVFWEEEKWFGGGLKEGI